MISKIGFDIPIAVIVFNRPRHTEQLLLELKKIRPLKLFIVADGPRPSKIMDLQLCEEVRALVDALVDWPCELHKNFREENLGCGLSPAQGIDWVFEYVERAIILEDDCLPSKSFFEFCKYGLERYLDDDRVMMISGNNHLLGKKKIQYSYFYSINTQTHGWATWKRAWNRYDFYMKDWPKYRSLLWLWSIHKDIKYAFKWRKIFDEVYKKANSEIKYDCWDFQWTYACWKNRSLNIIPQRNLVSNIGYGFDATHITPSNHPLAHLVAEDMNFPLTNPNVFSQDRDADRVLSKTVYGNYSLAFKIIRKLKRFLN